jgi:hypothetical protein
MKNGNTKMSAALVALMGLIKVSTAQADGHSFTPIENLPPEQRQVITEQLNELTKNINVDWEHIVVGVDENGKITIAPKEAVPQAHISSPSSFLSAAKPTEENQ